MLARHGNYQAQVPPPPGCFSAGPLCCAHTLPMPLPVRSAISLLPPSLSCNTVICCLQLLQIHLNTNSITTTPHPFLVHKASELESTKSLQALESKRCRGADGLPCGRTLGLTILPQ
eukprot:GHUV01037487.1.p2 GENE.GHUV01037487.1~~GHUV01037487.1.p2  ORF type:complete len:117 (+),score=16.32 GHUV01037487.1:907-1257(+)